MMLKLPRLTMNGKPYYMVEAIDIDKFDLSDFEKNGIVEMNFDGVDFKLVPIYTSIEEMTLEEKEQEVNLLLARLETERKVREDLEKEKKKLERENRKLESSISSSSSYGGCGSSSSYGGCGSSSSYDGGCGCTRSYRGGC